MTRIRNKTLKKIFDSGNNLTPAKWGRAIDVMYPTPDEGKDKIINTTYQELVNMIASNELIPGATYEFDYNNYLPFKSIYNSKRVYTNYNYDCKVRVKALTMNTISEDALYYMDQVTGYTYNPMASNSYKEMILSEFRPCKYSITSPLKYNCTLRGEYGVHSDMYLTIFKEDDLNSCKNILQQLKYYDINELNLDYETLKNYIGCYYRKYPYTGDLTIDFIQKYTSDDINKVKLTRYRFETHSNKQETIYDVILYPDELTGFVSDIQLHSGFLSYDIRGFVEDTLGRNITFIGNINEEHYVKCTALTNCTIINSHLDSYYYTDNKNILEDESLATLHKKTNYLPILSPVTNCDIKEIECDFSNVIMGKGVRTSIPISNIKTSYSTDVTLYISDQWYNSDSPDKSQFYKGVIESVEYKNKPKDYKVEVVITV